MTVDEKPPGRIAHLRDRFLEENRVEPVEVRRRLYVISATLIAVGLVAFVYILIDVLTGDRLVGIDRPVEQWVRARRSDEATTVMTTLSLIFGPLIFPFAAPIIVVVWCISTRHLWRPLLLTVGTAVGIVGVRLIAETVGRDRPPVDRMLLSPDMSESFPSGHVIGSATFILLIAYLVFSRRKSPRSAVLSFTLASLLVAATAVSRIYLGYHWATDTMGSVALALVILGVVIAVDTKRTVVTPAEMDARG
ncbi:phosphatase PAP2 family protein [Marisediminicola sp. LYQ85]|uniref:phosphatase PAP2 family protein n=1 Tax=Marisediminicola sp. LYQ85 TaxID=3391062 RepID=UPI003983CCD4